MRQPAYSPQDPRGQGELAPFSCFLTPGTDAHIFTTLQINKIFPFKMADIIGIKLTLTSLVKRFFFFG